MYFHVEKSSVAPCPVVATFWYGFLSFRSTEIVQLVSVLSGAGEDIPDTTILLNRNCRPLGREIIFTWGVVALADDDIANDAVTHHELKKVRISS